MKSDAVERFLAANQPRRVLVNSIPKSGTTWMRTMLAALPGYEEYPRQGVSGTDPEQLLLVAPGQVFHGHLHSSPRLLRTLDDLEFATVFVYRDLRDAVVSNYFHLAAMNPRRAPEIFATLDQEELLRADRLMEWCPPCKRYPDVRVWMDLEGVPTVAYEDLISDTSGQLRRILREMGFEETDPLVDDIVAATSFEAMSGRAPGVEVSSSPRRKGIIGDWRNHFSERNKEEFKAAFGHLLIEYGYEKDLNW